MRNNIVHPDHCSCTTCHRHNKEDKNDVKQYNRFLYCFYVCIFVICCLI